MSAVGPVCHIAPVTVTTPKVPSPIPSIPPPAQPTLQSLTATVNTLRQIIMIITGQNGTNGTNGSSKNSPGGSFQQTSVTTVQQRVYQNNDPTSQNYVDVAYVKQLVMGNNSTKSTWTYNAPPPSNGS